MTGRDVGARSTLLAALMLAHSVACGAAGSGGSGGTGGGSSPPASLAPQIAGFVAQPPIIRAGESSTLSWSVTGATSISIQGIGAVAGTTVPVTPAATTTYTLTATNAQGSSTATATVTIASGSTYELPADRATSWNLAGMLTRGGVPSASWSVCNPTALTPLGGGQDDSQQINARIEECAPGTVVKLGPGTFTMGEGRYVLVDKGVVLRGAGAGVTILDNPRNRVPTGTISDPEHIQAHIDDAVPIVIVGPSRWPASDGDTRCQGAVAYDPAHMQKLSADAVKGERSVTVENGSIFQAGQLVLLDETAGASWQPDRAEQSTSIWATPDYSVQWNLHQPALRGDEPTAPVTPSASNNWAGLGNGEDAACWFSRQDRAQSEIKEIAGVSDNTVTFTSPLHKGYRVGHHAELTTFTGSNQHLVNAGVESLTLAGGGDGALHFENAAYSWARNVEITRWGGDGVEFNRSFRIEFRDSYIHDGAWPSPGGGGYGISIAAGSAELLLENNISINANKVMVARSSGSGSVVAYNYMDGGYIFYNTAWIECGLNASHMVGPHHVLFEGNQSFNMDSDDTHGNSTYMTYFRNYVTTVREPFVGIVDIGTVNDAASPDHGPKRAVGAMRYSYWMSYVGNVLGKQGLTTAANGYVDVSPGLTGETSSMWMLGWNDADPYTSDPNVTATAIRDGNWEWFLGEQTWLNTESTGASPRLLPASMYLSAAPRFFGANPWPWVDPTTGMVYKLPAKARLDAGTPNVVP